MNLNNTQAIQFFQQQLSNWALAKKNFADLALIQTKKVPFDGFDIFIQFNPARIASSGAKLDTKSIAARKCFLCPENRPKEQKWIDVENYELLVNPFPIFPTHFTIASKKHVNQEIKPYFSDLLRFSKALSNFVVFYNGANCGASAPDHLHFQAGTKDFLPLFEDYQRLKEKNAVRVSDGKDVEVFLLKNYLRTVFCIETNTQMNAEKAFSALLEKTSESVNIAAYFENENWYIFVFPRKAFRPWQYNADENKQLLVSPGTAEMAGVLITPLKEHFDKINKADIESIYEQVASPPPAEAGLLSSMVED